MDKKTEKCEDVLVFREKPYYTDKELELYYRIAIDESLKQGHPELAAHYRILLDLLKIELWKINRLAYNVAGALIINNHYEECDMEW